MTINTLPPFQRTLEVSQHWLNDVQQQLHVEDEQRAYDALRAVLHATRDRLTPDEATDLAAQLPMLLRGLYFEQWKPSATPEKLRNRDEFLQAVAAQLPQQDLDPNRAVEAVFGVLQSRITAGEIEDVRSMFPKGLQDLWGEETG